MRFFAVVFVILLACVPALAQDLRRDTIPGKWLEPLLPEDLPKLDYPAYFTGLDRARLEAFTGRYKLALMTLAKAKDADPIAAALIRAEALAATGRQNEAIAALSQPQIAENVRALVRKAIILSETGKLHEAIALLKATVAKEPGSIAAHYYLAYVLEQSGDLAAAREELAWFVIEPQKFLEKAKADSINLESAEDLTLVGRALDRHATLAGSYQTDESLHDTILGIFVKAYDVVDRKYWPSHVAAAEYFLSHDNTQQARNELMAALKVNPQDAHAIELLGLISLAQYDFDGVDRASAKLRRVNPTSIRAEILDSRNLLLQRSPTNAEKPLRRALTSQPKNIEVLGLLAACHALRLKDKDMTAALKQVEEIDPDNATAYFDVAEQLGAMRQYPRAAEMYKIAIERAPWWTAARNGLGLLYTQSGDEDLARSTLEAAHSLDPFNLATTNYLRLLDDLARFARKETANFVVMYNAELDPVIPEYFSEYLESVHEEVCRDFACTPSVKTFIEVFPTHDAFSVRTTGSPWIGTVGASTGRVIALVSPRGGVNTMGPFNWSQVLRHEYTHTVTLAATDNRIPHWMTEGLAVWEEKSPLQWAWVPMLYRTVKNDELFSMENLTWAFVRPKKASDRQLAYAQSFWVCRYIDETYGHDVILKMLEGYKAGKSQEEVFPETTKKEISEFEKEFAEWAKKEIATWGYDKETSEKYDKLRAKAEELVKGRRFVDATKAWEEIVAIRPVDPLPHQRLAGLYRTKEVNQPEKAIEHLIALSRVELHDNKYDKGIARMYRQLGKLVEAQKYALKAVYTDPYDKDAHELLAIIYEQTGNVAGAEKERRVIAVVEKWVEDNRKRNLGE